jgi:hypothetical protein
MKRFFIGALILLSLLFAGWSWLALKFVYSRGERVGYIQKISQRGWIFKTFEGELAMANMPGTMPQIFQFTVRDEAVAHQIEKSAGQRVSLGYEYHPGLPGTMFGETQYFVIKMTTVADPYQVNVQHAPQPAAAPVAK